MSKVDENLRMLKILVESTSNSIEPFRGLLQKNSREATSKNEMAQLERLRFLTIDGFFYCAARGVTFTDVSGIAAYFGRTLEEAYPGVSATFMKLARTYWTFKLILNDCTTSQSVCTSLLCSVDIDFAGVFFPFPGPVSPPKKLREKTMRTLIVQSGADLDVEDFIRCNFYLR